MIVVVRMSTDSYLTIFWLGPDMNQCHSFHLVTVFYNLHLGFGSGGVLPRDLVRSFLISFANYDVLNTALFGHEVSYWLYILILIVS
jgi:hypothetical protein